jgi:hypothetical protein
MGVKLGQEGLSIMKLASKVLASHMDFYFGVLLPVAHTLSRLLEEPSLATTI